jgi:DNA-binding protein H-NS
MGRASNLDKFNLDELVALRAEVDARLAERQASERNALRQRLADLAREQGFSLDEIVGASRKRGPAPIKYRDPKNPMNTWSGRGRTPRWLVAATKGGRAKIEDFRV